MKPKGWLKYMKKRPRELRINDEDLLITAIVKNKDLDTCHKFASGFSAAKKFKKLKSHKKVNKLISKIGKAGTNLLGGKRVSLARKTVICWLLATGFLTVKDVIQYRDPKSHEVIKDGLVTWEGVVCNCCKKTLSVSGFMAHAGCSHPQSSLGLFLESGKSYTLCQVEAWSAEFMSRRSNAWGRKVEAIDESDDTCGFCGDGGELLCCDNCPSTYHQACLSAKVSIIQFFMVPLCVHCLKIHFILRLLSLTLQCFVPECVSIARYVNESILILYVKLFPT